MPRRELRVLVGVVKKEGREKGSGPEDDMLLFCWSFAAKAG